MLRFLSFVSSIGKEAAKEEESEEHVSVKIEITCIIPVFQAFLDFFLQISLAFNMFSTLMLVEVKLSRN